MYSQRLKPGSLDWNPRRTIDQVTRLCPTGELPEMAKRLVFCWQWIVAGGCYIRDKNEKIIQLEPNRAQETIFATMLLQSLRGVPVRVAILKARKLGASTIVSAVFYFLCRHYRNQRALMLAHNGDSTHEIFDIARRIGDKDLIQRPRVNRTLMFFYPEDGIYNCQTAGGEGVGAGGTPNLLHLSEVALWPHTKKEESRYTATNAVPAVLTTIIVEESTARGRELFFKNWDAARVDAHPYDQVFLPWFLDEELTAIVPDEFTLDEDESQLVQIGLRYGVPIADPQLAWRREKIADIGEHRFRQEYPSTPEESISAEKGQVLAGMRECLIDELPFAYDATEWDQERVGGIDFGFYDATAIVHAVYRDQVLYVVGTYRATKGLSSEHAEELAVGHRYYCDPSAVQAREDMRATLTGNDGIGLVGAPRAKAAGGDMVIQEWRAVSSLIRQSKLFILTSVAEQLIIEADNLFWNSQTGKPDQTRGSAWGHFDTLDALRYCVMGVLTRHGAIERPKERDDIPRSRRDRMRAM